ncbi:hypothetical protein C6503_10810 [Candidatus Poribacteria bacterium]|nr:MAG: hypothetical protein C6503_10810 [Candidatus Poribacteria bacterium]
MGIGSTAVAVHRTSFRTVHIQTDSPQRPYAFISFGRAQEFPVVFVPENIYVENTGTSQPKKTVALKNPRESSLMIQNIKSSQAWIQPLLRSGNVVYPWRAADIELNFETDQMPKGRFHEKLIVEYIDHKGEIRTITLPISGDGSQVYTLAPERFFFGQVKSAGKRTKVLVLSNHTNIELKIEKAETDIGTIVVKRQENSHNYQLTLTLPSVLTKGVLKGEVRLRTSHPKMQLIKIPVFAFVTE